MDITRADLNLFVVFDAIYTQGGVSRAASHLNLSQPAISHALARLRDQIGDPLFVRQGQKLAPTPKAEAMAASVRQALDLLGTAAGERAEFDPATSDKHFAIGMRSLMESSYLLSLFNIFQGTSENLTLSSVSFDRQRMRASLASRDLDAVIDVFQPIQEGVQRLHLSTENTVVVARRGHPVIDETLDLEKYLSSSHVCVTSRPKGHGPEDVALSRLGKTRTIAARCQQINTAMRLVSMSNHVLTMSETFARRANIWFDHQILRSPLEMAQTDIYLYWHQNAENDPAHTWLRQAIVAAASS